jgi:hypothetical protein
MELMDLDLDLGDDLHMRALVKEDAALLAEATSGEPAPSLWGPRPAGPYSLCDAQAALLWRVKADLKLPVLELLPDGSYSSVLVSPKASGKARSVICVASRTRRSRSAWTLRRPAGRDRQCPYCCLTGEGPGL